MPGEKKVKKGAPAYMATFADLMALMMCFFVLLFSFSQIDETKYRMMAESMAKGFGQQKVRITAPSAPSASLSSPSSINSPFSQMQAPSRSSRSRNRVQTTQSTQATAKQVKAVMKNEIAEGKRKIQPNSSSTDFGPKFSSLLVKRLHLKQVENSTGAGWQGIRLSFLVRRRNEMGSKKLFVPGRFCRGNWALTASRGRQKGIKYTFHN